MRRALLGAVAAALLLATAACAGEPGTAGTSAGTEEVSIAGGDHVGAAQFLVAESEDLWADVGLTARRQAYPSGRDALNALLGGQAELATIGDLPTVTALLNGQDIRIVGTLSRGTQWRLLTTTDSGIAGFPDLRGKRIGVTEGTNTQYLLSRILDDAGLGTGDVTVVNLAPNQVPVALSAGDIDAGLTFPTFYAATRTALGDRYAELGYDGYESPTVLVAAPTVPDERITATLRALAAAQDLIDADPVGARAAVVAGSGGSLSAETAAELWPLYRIDLRLDEELVTELTDEARWALDTLSITADRTPDAVRAALHPAPLRTVRPGAVTVD